MQYVSKMIELFAENLQKNGQKITKYHKLSNIELCIKCWLSIHSNELQNTNNV
jgi:hypothetical protein